MHSVRGQTSLERSALPMPPHMNESLSKGATFTRRCHTQSYGRVFLIETRITTYRFFTDEQKKTFTTMNYKSVPFNYLLTSFFLCQVFKNNIQEEACCCHFDYRQSGQWSANLRRKRSAFRPPPPGVEEARDEWVRVRVRVAEGTTPRGWPGAFARCSTTGLAGLASTGTAPARQTPCC